MNEHYQSATQRLLEFAAETVGDTEMELRAELAADGVNVEAFLHRMGQEAGLEAELTGKTRAMQRLRGWLEGIRHDTGPPSTSTELENAPVQEKLTTNYGDAPTLSSSPGISRAIVPLRLKIFSGLAVALVACFAAPLSSLVRFAWHSNLCSYILLVPLISAYLIWTNKRRFEPASEPKRILALIPLTLGLVAMACYEFGRQASWDFKEVDKLALLTFGFLCFLLAEAFLLVGTKTLSRVAFPACFLAFMIPFPTPVLDRIESFLQHGSAYVAHGFFLLAGMPVVRTGTLLELPGFSMLVAPECSGIRSTVVLFMVSFVAGYLLLKSRWTRATLVLAVVPLALLRNALRIFTIGELCVQVSPDMIESFIHRHGGPIFFVLSLIPFFLFLLWLRRIERARPDRLHRDN